MLEKRCHRFLVGDVGCKRRLGAAGITLGFDLFHTKLGFGTNCIGIVRLCLLEFLLCCIKVGKELVNQIQPEERPFEILDTALGGFLLRVQPSGTKTYYFAYRSQSGLRQRIKIGRVGNLLA